MKRPPVSLGRCSLRLKANATKGDVFSRERPEGRQTSCKLTFSAFSRCPGLPWTPLDWRAAVEIEKLCTAVCPCAVCCSSCVRSLVVVKQAHGVLQACLHKQVFQLKANVFLRCCREHYNMVDQRTPAAGSRQVRLDRGNVRQKAELRK